MLNIYRITFLLRPALSDQTKGIIIKLLTVLGKQKKKGSLRWLYSHLENHGAIKERLIFDYFFSFSAFVATDSVAAELQT